MNGLGRQLFRDLPGSLGWGIVPPVPTPTRRPGPRPVEGALALAGWLVLAQGCGDPSPVNVFEQHAVGKALAPYGVTMSPVPEETAELGWQAPPADCPHAYRITAHYEPVLRFEDDNEASLIVGRHPGREPDVALGPGPVPPNGMVPALLFYQGIRAERRGATRDLYVTRELIGPAAPTAACMPRTWDPMEDAFALGWPQLTGRLTAVGEHWNGMRVGGKCSRSACVDPESGGGGPEVHDLSCVVPPWHERLAGLFEHEGERYAWIVSEWSDGHGVGQGIHTERRTLVSVDHGRPLWSQTRMDHRFAQPLAEGGFGPVVRTWTLESIDACPGSLAAAGWPRPPELAAEETRLRDRLEHTDELRRSPPRRPPDRNPPE